MPYTVNKLLDMPVILFQTPPGSDLSGEIEAAIGEMSSLLDAQTEPVFLVMDVSNVTLGLDDIMHGASLAARGQNPLLHHPGIRENVYVATDAVTKMALKGLTTATFGQVKLSRFDTVEEALSYCRRKNGATLGF